MAKVWIPTANGIVHPGRYEYTGENTGSSLKGIAFSDALQSAIKCRIMTPLTSGAWWTALPVHGLSVLGNPDKIDTDNIIDYRRTPTASCSKITPQVNIMSKSNNPSLNLSPVNPILGQTGGIPIPSTTNVPPGVYPRLKVGQNVLVGFISSSTTPIILGTLPTDKEWKAVLG